MGRHLCPQCSAVYHEYDAMKNHLLMHRRLRRKPARPAFQQDTGPSQAEIDATLASIREAVV